jgi:hypothetical protein
VSGQCRAGAQLSTEQSELSGERKQTAAGSRDRPEQKKTSRGADPASGRARARSQAEVGSGHDRGLDQGYVRLTAPHATIEPIINTTKKIAIH